MAEIRRGPMTDADRAEIERLALTLKKPTPGVIAARIGRHAATVTWFMLTRGLLERPARHSRGPYLRAGRMVYPYCPKQDARLLELLADPSIPPRKRYSTAAAAMTAAFGVPRTAHSVAVRAVQLAADPGAEALLDG